MMIATHPDLHCPISSIFAADKAHNTSSTMTTERPLRTFAPKEHVFFEGDKRDHIYEVVEGVVCVYKLTADGRRQVVSFCYPGSLLGFGHENGYLYSAEVLSPAKVQSYPSAALENVAAERPDLAQSLLSFMMAELSAARDQLLTLGCKSAPEKIASFLLDLSRHNEEVGDCPQTLKLPMTRSDIADYLGLTIETVSRNITKLKSSGVIDLHQNTTIVIRDMDGLENIASCDEGRF